MMPPSVMKDMICYDVVKQRETIVEVDVNRNSEVLAILTEGALILIVCRQQTTKST
jgi:hypothetical protein